MWPRRSSWRIARRRAFSASRSEMTWGPCSRYSSPVRSMCHGRRADGGHHPDEPGDDRHLARQLAQGSLRQVRPRHRLRGQRRRGDESKPVPPGGLWQQPDRPGTDVNSRISTIAGTAGATSTGNIDVAGGNLAGGGPSTLEGTLPAGITLDLDSSTLIAPPVPTTVNAGRINKWRLAFMSGNVASRQRAVMRCKPSVTCRALPRSTSGAARHGLGLSERGRRAGASASCRHACGPLRPACRCPPRRGGAIAG